MKKFISILLAAIVIVSSLSIPVFADEEADDLKIAIASDLHYNVPSEELEGNPSQPFEIDDPIYWYANRRAAMDEESGFIIDEFLRQCAEDDSIEYVLIPGDLADNGRIVMQEHLDVAEKFRAFEEATGKSVFVINGNHDASLNNDDTTFEDFMTIYADFGYDKAIDRLDGTCSYTADLGDKYRLIALDSCHANYSTEDGMTTAKVNWVCNMAKKATKEGRYPILMMHHNLIDHLPMQRIISRNFIVRNHLVTADKFANAGIKVVFSGHEHCSDAAVQISSLGNKIYDFATTALSMYPLQYRVFAFDDDEIKYETRTVDSIDTDVLTSTIKGYSEEQISLMNEGLNAYAKGFLKVGVQYRLSLSLSMEKMGIEEDAIYYGLVKTVMDKLTSALETPFYGEGGIAQQMKKYGITIPESDYVNGWDLATDLVADHYAGDEHYSVYGDEVAILLRTVAFVLREELGLLSGDTLTASADALIKDNDLTEFKPELENIGTSVFGTGITPLEYFVVALVSPLLHKFANDDDGVNDNYGTLEGYGTVTSESQFENVIANIKGFFERLKFYAEMIFSIFAKMWQ